MLAVANCCNIYIIRTYACTNAKSTCCQFRVDILTIIWNPEIGRMKIIFLNRGIISRDNIVIVYALSLLFRFKRRFYIKCTYSKAPRTFWGQFLYSLSLDFPVEGGKWAPLNGCPRFGKLTSFPPRAVASTFRWLLFREKYMVGCICESRRFCFFYSFLEHIDRRRYV